MIQTCTARVAVALQGARLGLVRLRHAPSCITSFRPSHRHLCLDSDSRCSLERICQLPSRYVHLLYPSLLLLHSFAEPHCPVRSLFFWIVFGDLGKGDDSAGGQPSALSII